MKQLFIWLACIAAALAVIITPILLVVSYSYRWKQACINQNGTAVELASSSDNSNVCIAGPIQIIPISVPPW